MGHSRRFDGAPVTSGLRRLADILRAGRHVAKVPIDDIGRLAEMKEAAD
ncbi:MAG: hypothetical protein JWP25_2780 [Bradyrhizobium sp.]|nr:hypothetical protein [Bradyrhizobium sp.]